MPSSHVHTQRSRAQFCPFLLKFDKLQLTANWQNLSLHLLPQHFLPLPLTFHVTLLLLCILSIQYVAFVGPSLNLILAAHFLSTLLLNVGQLEPLQVKHSCSFELLIFFSFKNLLVDLVLVLGIEDGIFESFDFDGSVTFSSLIKRISADHTPPLPG